ncbi:MAG: hypothetical protein L6R42_004539 [Xanthoria sp. 1 TBL-2021]|nr:MAG: hypothetical protein L6R42_004539 [Xanthoria sp. 1 TBL-2021]
MKSLSAPSLTVGPGAFAAGETMARSVAISLPATLLELAQRRPPNVERGDIKSTFSAEEDENADGDEDAEDEEAVDGPDTGFDNVDDLEVRNVLAASNTLIPINGLEKRKASPEPNPKADPKEKHQPPDNIFVGDDAIEKDEAMSGKPVVHSVRGRCWLVRKEYLDNCVPLRSKAGFDWDIFFFCYSEGDCPPKTLRNRRALLG